MVNVDFLNMSAVSMFRGAVPARFVCMSFAFCWFRV